MKFLVPFLVRVLRTEARLFTAQLSTWLVPRALFSKAARQARVARLSPPCAARDVATERDVHAVS